MVDGGLYQGSIKIAQSHLWVKISPVVGHSGFV